MAVRYKLIEFSPEEASVLSYLTRHPNTKTSKDQLDTLKGPAYQVGKILVYGTSPEDLPGYREIAKAYQNWRDVCLKSKPVTDKRRKIRLELSSSL